VQLNQKKPEVRSEVCNLCSVVTETFGVLSSFRVTQCYSYSKIKSVIINCNSSWRISNKSSVKSRTHKLFVALPSKHATVLYLIDTFLVLSVRFDRFYTEEG
jgi:hypothetical protein